MRKEPIVVTIFGTSKAKSGQEPYEIAYRLGRGLALKGFVIANGGYGGTMLAAAQGAREVGGETIGVTCSTFGRSVPNPFIVREVRTSTLEERLARLIELGSAYVVLPGGTGTLLELAEVWELKNKRLAGQRKPIIIWRSFWEPLVDLMRSADPECTASVYPAESVEMVLQILESIQE